MGYKDLHLQGVIAIEPDLDFIFSRIQHKPLKEPVEVVDDTDVRLVHVDVGFITESLRRHLDPHVSIIGTVRSVAIRAMTSVPVTVVAMAVPIAVMMPILRMGFGRKRNGGRCGQCPEEGQRDLPSRSECCERSNGYRVGGWRRHRHSGLSRWLPSRARVGSGARSTEPC